MILLLNWHCLYSLASSCLEKSDAVVLSSLIVPSMISDFVMLAIEWLIWCWVARLLFELLFCPLISGGSFCHALWLVTFYLLWLTIMAKYWILTSGFHWFQTLVWNKVGFCFWTTWDRYCAWMACCLEPSQEGMYAIAIFSSRDQQMLQYLSTNFVLIYFIASL